MALLFVVSAAARADLLDEPETGSSKAQGGSVPATSTPSVLPVEKGEVPKPGSEPAKGNGTAGEKSVGAAKNVESQGKAATDIKGVAKDKGTVLAPKNPNKPRPVGREKQPVHFESSGLKGLREKGWMELESDVVVTQGAMRLEADHAEIFFDEQEKEVVRVVANGNVRINNVDENTGEKMRAYGDQVVFNNKERVVVLEGNARLLRGNDSVVRGKKITYELDSGWIRADRVAGELTPQEKPK